MTKAKGFTKADMDDVSDNPEWTQETNARAKSFDETFPDIARRIRGPQKAPTKKQVTLRLDPRVVDHFKAEGEGWQSRMNEALMKAAGVTHDPGVSRKATSR
jgi:uncharacterized protein (DUF4415 family)